MPALPVFEVWLAELEAERGVISPAELERVRARARRRLAVYARLRRRASVAGKPNGRGTDGRG